MDLQTWAIDASDTGLRIELIRQLIEKGILVPDFYKRLELIDALSLEGTAKFCQKALENKQAAAQQLEAFGYGTPQS